MFDHVKFGVSDYAASKAFFLAALEPLGVVVVSEGVPTYGIEMSADDKVSLCLFETDEKPAPLHLAFVTAHRRQVDAFHRAALAAGGSDNGPPGLRPNYHANYYAAFVIGPDGHNVEAVCHLGEGLTMPSPVAKASALVRAPRSEVFDAFVDPAQLTRFWLNAASGPLAVGTTVTWEFMVPGATEQVRATALRRPSHIAFDWSSGLHVTLDFAEQAERLTRVAVEVTGFADDAGIDPVVNTTEGFAIVLCDLKTLFESGRSANLVKDKAELIVGDRSAKRDAG